MIHVALFGIEAGMAALLTYLVHSTAWIVAALLLTRWHRQLSPAARHVVWRAALLGPLASGAFALGLGHRWQWALTQPPLADEAWAAALPAAAAPPLAARVEFMRDSASASAPLSVELMQRMPWFTLLAACWTVVALVGVLLIARAAVRLRHALEERTQITDSACIGVLQHLMKRAGIRRHVRLSRCAAASTPLALNTREICLPDRALRLDRGALEAVLAHELAHIERRDGLWLNGALLLQVLLWFQPLNRKARAELRATAELAADDRAVELTGDALGLARTLTDVASWVSGSRLVPSVAMARPGSPIVERVARLVESSDGRTRARFESRTPWFTIAALAAIGACSPSVGAPRAVGPGTGLAPSNPDPAATAVLAQPAPLSDVRPLPAAPVPAGAAPDHDDPRDRAPGPVLECSLPEPQPDCPAAHGADGEDLAKGTEPARSAAMPRLTIQGAVNDVMQLARTEQQLALQIQLAEQAAAKPDAAAQARLRSELARLKTEFAAATERRTRLERDIKARLDAWSKDFERRFGREQAPRMAAWGEKFERRMRATAKELERQLSRVPDPRAR
jgi:beta-lactamase regulating signal transducer with metallopeptidase domain